MNYDHTREEDITIVSRTTRACALKQEADRLRQWFFWYGGARVCANCAEENPAMEHTAATFTALKRFERGDRSPSTMRWVYPLIEAYNRDKFDGERPGA